MKPEWERYSTIVRTALYYIAIMLILFVVDRWGLMNAPKGLAEAGLGYVYMNVSKVGEFILRPFVVFDYWNDGVERVADLENRLAEMAVDYEELDRLNKENEVLKSMNKVFIAEYDGELEMAYVIRTGAKLGIIVGEETSLISGMEVVTAEGIFVGVIGNISNRFAEVVTPIDAEMRLPVRVVGEKTLGVLVGDGSMAELVEVLQDEPLKKGDLLMTAGDENMREGLVVGQITDLRGEVADVTKTAGVELLAGDVDIVFIME